MLLFHKNDMPSRKLSIVIKIHRSSTSFQISSEEEGKTKNQPHCSTYHDQFGIVLRIE